MWAPLHGAGAQPCCIYLLGTEKEKGNGHGFCTLKRLFRELEVLKLSIFYFNAGPERNKKQGCKILGSHHAMMSAMRRMWKKSPGLILVQKWSKSIKIGLLLNQAKCKGRARQNIPAKLEKKKVLVGLRFCSERRIQA